MGATFRTVFKFLVPSWLSSGEGGLVLESLTQVVDDYSQRAREALEMRMPTRAADDALALLGADRAILRGRTETSAHYAQRLLSWRFPRGHRTRGSAFALLQQISEYFGGLLGKTRDVSGNVAVRTAAGVETVSNGNAWNWDGAGATPQWGRFWVEINSSQFSAWGNFGDPATWHGALGVFGDSIGVVGASPDDFEAIRGLFTSRTPWNPMGTTAEWLIVNLDGTAPAPDGLWLHWSKTIAGVQQASRYAGFRYVSLNPANNVYRGNSANFCTSFNIPGGGSYSGDSSNFPASITLPDGSTYVGNPNNFPASIDLVDDGDQTT